MKQRVAWLGHYRRNGLVKLDGWLLLNCQGFSYCRENAGEFPAKEDVERALAHWRTQLSNACLLSAELCILPE